MRGLKISIIRTTRELRALGKFFHASRTIVYNGWSLNEEEVIEFNYLRWETWLVY